MYRFLAGRRDVYSKISERVKELYKSKLLPLEEAYRFHEFHSPPLSDAHFDAKPMVLLVGQYSTGKSTFIRHLIDQDYPGIRIGPEPTTDRFIAIMGHQHAQTETLPGNALVVDPSKPFGSLSRFGNHFLNRLQCSMLRNPVLDSLTFIDTPGILSGEKQRIDRGYDFSLVLEWFAERADRILLLFDAHKLDVSDEFRQVMEHMKAYEDKVRIVLNKADSIQPQQLFRVYGALMWALGKILQTPEVASVTVGSFWDRQMQHTLFSSLFELEETDLYNDLRSLPRNSVIRKINDLIRRTRLSQVHAQLISKLRQGTPRWFGREEAQKKLLANFDQIFREAQSDLKIFVSPKDYPSLNRMRHQLGTCDFLQFDRPRAELMRQVESFMTQDVAQLMQQVTEETADQPESGPSKGAFETIANTPFSAFKGVDAGRGDPAWIVSKFRADSDSSFERLKDAHTGNVSAETAREQLSGSKLPSRVLSLVWKLSDIDQDLMLDKDEWALANYLIRLNLEGHELPDVLPNHLVPPSKRTGGSRKGSSSSG